MGGGSVARRVHRASAWLVVVVGCLHCGVTPVLFSEWRADAVWFLAGGMGLVLVGAMNLTGAVGGTARVIAVSNGAFLVLGVAALPVVRVPQFWAAVLGLLGMSLANLGRRGETS